LLKILNKKEVYIVYIIRDDYSASSILDRNIIFATENYDKAEKWVIKFNKIIRDNKNRIKNCKNCFMYDDIAYFDDVYADIMTIELR